MRLSTRDTHEPVDLAKINLLDPQFYANGDPHAVWEHLRRHAPVYRQSLHGGQAFWVVSRHQDVCRVLKESDTFTSQLGTILCILNTPDVASGRMMATTDPPRHRLFRKPLEKALNIHAMKAYTSEFSRLVSDFLAPGISGGDWDIAVAARMFPMAITGVVMGIPKEYWKRLSHLTTMAVASEDPAFAEGTPQETLRFAHHELFAYFAYEIGGRRQRGRPGEDLIGVLMTMEVEGAPLSDEEILFNCYSLLVGANVTTANSISAMFQVLSENPEEFQRWARHPELLAPGVEEGLRWSSPASHFMRYAKRDTRIGDVSIAAGDPVTAWLGSANRDEEVFDDPYRFNVGRAPNPHVAFGYGSHFCVGAALARLGLGLLFDEILHKVESIELVGPVEHLASNFVAGFRHMPVRMNLHRTAATQGGS